MKPSSYLFLFTIGPVQSFIVQARKAHDLYAGSALLSELIKVAIQQVGQARIIFPYVKNQDLNSLFSLPNRFIAQVDLLPEERQVFGEYITKKVRNFWQNEAQRALNSRSAPEGFWEQINQHLKISWVLQEVDPEKYAQHFSQIEKQLGKVKNLPTFEQFNYEDTLGEKGRKCSLDGERNALFFGPKTNPKYYKVWNKQAYVKPVRRLDKNEGLSAVSYLKRFYEYHDKKQRKLSALPSTAYVTLLDTLNQVDSTILQKYQEAFEFNVKKIFEENTTIRLTQEDHWIEYDEDFLFEENLVSKYVPAPLQLKQIRQVHLELTNFFAKQGLKFNKYYAVLLFDVDQMGGWLSGEKLLPDYQKEKLREFHQEFSKLLLEYAQETRQLLSPENQRGQVVYAGGDDFLGFVNLTHLFDAVVDLKETFQKQVATQIEATYADANTHLHFSAGVVIAHYKTPFSEVLKKARQMESLAKTSGGRNAFAMATMKHSGEVQETVFKWGAGPSNLHWQALHHITNALRSDVVSSKFIFNLSTELYQLAGINSVRIDQPDAEALFIEFRRLLLRAKSTTTTPEQINQLWNALKDLYRASQAQKQPIRNFIHSLHIADFISRNP